MHRCLCMIHVLFITDVVTVFFLSLRCTPSSFTIWIRYLYSWSCLKTKQNCYWDDWNELLQWLQQIFLSNYCVLDIWKQPGLVSGGTWNKMKLARSRVCCMRNKSNTLAKKTWPLYTTGLCFFPETPSFVIRGWHSKWKREVIKYLVNCLKVFISCGKVVPSSYQNTILNVCMSSSSSCNQEVIFVKINV